jgi:hypothetical protein
MYAGYVQSGNILISVLISVLISGWQRRQMRRCREMCRSSKAQIARAKVYL